MGTVGFLWTPGMKMGYFKLTWDPEDTEDPEGIRLFVFLFPTPTIWVSTVYGFPWTPTVKIWHFELTQLRFGILS